MLEQFHFMEPSAEINKCISTEIERSVKIDLNAGSHIFIGNLERM